MNTKTLSENPEHSETIHMQWMGIPYTLTWKPECFGGLTAHIEIRSKNNSPIPIAETGYRSCFIGREIVEALG